jgi:pimeloyl-ACP methyl ester carboxylesterase
MKHTCVQLFRVATFVLLAATSSIVNAQTSTTKNIVIVHGAFADGSGWEAVFKLLQAKGYNVTVVQNPLTSLEDDVDATNRAIDKQPGKVILVGHSWGGAVITQAGVHPKVSSLVYVAAFVPDMGQTALDLIMTARPATENGILPADEKGFVYYDKAKFHMGFAADLPREKADFMFASQGPVTGKCFITPLTQVAWKSKPTYAIVATEDKSINPDIERAMYKRANAKITEVKSSHVVYMSHPKVVADFIDTAAKEATKLNP